MPGVLGRVSGAVPLGGLMHAAAGAEEDADGNVLLVTSCDQCGRSEDQLDEI